MFMLCESQQDEKEVLKMDNNRYKANVKYDGERAIAIKQDDNIFLLNRRGSLITEQFAEIVEELKRIDNNFIIDGEIVAYDEKFNSLQRRALTKDKTKREKLQKEIPCKYMIFDILSFANETITSKPLRERLATLNGLLVSNSNFLFLLEYGEIKDILEKVKTKLGEGIIIKDMEARYEGRRSKSWLKHKLFKEEYLTISTYTINPKGIRATDNNGNAVQIAGKNGTEVRKMIDEKGYADICIQYLEKTTDNRYRFISYRGLKNEVKVND